MFKDPLGLLSLLALLALMTACTLPLPKIPDSPYAKTPIGSTLELNQALEIPPGSTRVYIQNGQLSRRFNHYAPNCNIEVRRIDHEASQTVAAGVYRIVRVQSSYDENVKSPAAIQLAALGSFTIAESVDSGSTMMYAGYHLYLEGADPNVMRLSCRGVYADPSYALPPSVTEIRQALGELMTLRLPEPGRTG